LWFQLLIGLVLIGGFAEKSRAEIVELDSGSGWIPVSDELGFMKDVDRSLTIEQVAAPAFAERFEEGNWQTFMYQEYSGVVWVRFTVRRSAGDPSAEEWFLLFGRPTLESLDMYHSLGPADGAGPAGYARFQMPGDTGRSLLSHMVRLPLETDQERTFFLRLQGDIHPGMYIYFCTGQGRAHRNYRMGAFSGMFHGFMLVIAAITLFFFLLLRDRSHLWQFLFLVSSILYFLVEHGLIQLHLPDMPFSFVASWNMFWIGMMVAWFALFSHSFLETRRLAPGLDKLILAFAAYGFGMSLCGLFLPYEIMRWMVVVVGVFVPIVALVPGFVCLRRGHKAARFYLVAWAVFSVTTPLAATVFVQSKWGGVLFESGVLAGAILLTVALLDRMRLMRRESEQMEVAARVAERQMMRADKMAALGQIIAGVAHEINNPNNFIFFNLPIMKRYMAEIEPLLARQLEAEPNLKILNMPYEAFIADVYKLLETMQHGSERITKIVAELKDYVHGGDEEKREPVQVEKLVEQVTALIGKQMSKMTKQFEVEVSADLPPIFVNPGKLEQVLINLLINAGHAADKDDSWVALRAKVIRGDTTVVEITIEDNGSGIDEALVDKIFDPFFTTKERGVGTGLGLSISKKIVETYGGTLRLTSKAGEGSCFTLRLPVDREPAGSKFDQPQT
jgi:signal transduction histidine kinase